MQLVGGRRLTEVEVSASFLARPPSSGPSPFRLRGRIAGYLAISILWPTWLRVFPCTPSPRSASAWPPSNAERLLSVVAHVRVNPRDTFVRVPLDDGETQLRSCSLGVNGEAKGVGGRPLHDVTRHLSTKQRAKPARHPPGPLPLLRLDAHLRRIALRPHGCRKVTLPGFALEVELVLAAQHTIRLVHGFLLRSAIHVRR